MLSRARCDHRVDTTPMRSIAHASTRTDSAQTSTDETRILVIDDEAAIRDSLRMILEYEGYEFIGAATGQDGLSRCRARGAGPGAPRHQDAGHGRPRGAAASCRAARRALPVVDDLRPRAPSATAVEATQARRVRLHREAAVAASACSSPCATRSTPSRCATRTARCQARDGVAVPDRRRQPGAARRARRRRSARRRPTPRC